MTIVWGSPFVKSPPGGNPLRSRSEWAVAVLVMLSLLSCGEERSKTPHVEGATPSPIHSWLDLVPAGAKESLLSYRQLVERRAAAESAESADVDALRAECTRRQEAMAQELTPEDRAGVLVALERYLKDEVPKASKKSGRQGEVEAFFALFRALDQGGHYDLYREILLQGRADQFLRIAAADAMASQDLVRAGTEFMEIITGDHVTSLTWQDGLLDLLAVYDSPFVVDVLLEVLKKAKDEQAKIKAGFLARRYPDPRWIPVLKKAAEDDPKAYVRINAAQSLGLLVGEPATPFLEGLILRAENTLGAPPHLLEGMRTALEEAKKAGRGPLALAWK